MADDKDKDRERREREEESPSKPSGAGSAGRRPSLRGLARRVFGDDESAEDLPPDEERREEPNRTRELLGAALATGDKARMEVVRLVAREVRSYLEALELHKDLHHLLTHYSLEVHASVSLKPLADAKDAEPEEGSEPGVRVGLRKKRGS